LGEFLLASGNFHDARKLCKALVTKEPPKSRNADLSLSDEGMAVNSASSFSNAIVDVKSFEVRKPNQRIKLTPKCLSSSLSLQS